MSLYTSICFVPDDAKWSADESFVRAVAEYLGVDRIEIFTICRIPKGREQVQQLEWKQRLSLNAALQLQQVSKTRYTHMMFPYGETMKRLMDTLVREIPKSLFQDYAPWDSSISNGYWRIFDYDDGSVQGSSRFSFTMSGSGCPRDLAEYLTRFNRVRLVVKLADHLSSLSNLKWRTVINLS